MKNLCALVLWLTVIALLCGCVASRASELPAPTDPVNQPAAPQLSLNAEPKPEPMMDDVHSMDLTQELSKPYTGDDRVQDVILIRTYNGYVKHTTAAYRNAHPEYDKEFFSAHSLIYIMIESDFESKDISCGEITRDEDGVYHLDLRYDIPCIDTPEYYGPHYTNILVEVDHIIDMDAHIVFHSTVENHFLLLPISTEPPQNETPELLNP